MELKNIIEALLFSSQKPLTPAELAGVLAEAAKSEEPEAQSLAKTKGKDLEPILDELASDHEAAGRSFRLVCVAGAWQFVTRPDYAVWLQALMGERARPAKLSQPALETLTIVAYRQPLTRAEIEEIRGVSVDGVMQTLVERGLVEQVGRAEAPGRPMTYGTTRLFLECFGLRDLDELPAADELRRLTVEKPAGLLTADPGLATVPPDELAPEIPPEAVAEPPSETEAAPPGDPDGEAPRAASNPPEP